MNNEFQPLELLVGWCQVYDLQIKTVIRRPKQRINREYRISNHEYRTAEVKKQGFVIVNC